MTLVEYIKEHGYNQRKVDLINEVKYKTNYF